MRVASVAPVRGRTDSIVAYARRYPHAFTFMSDQELAMIADVGRIATGRGNPLWGLDQAFGVTHALDRLAVLPVAKSNAALIRRYRDSASTKEQVRKSCRTAYIALIGNGAVTTTATNARSS